MRRYPGAGAYAALLNKEFLPDLLLRGHIRQGRYQQDTEGQELPEAVPRELHFMIVWYFFHGCDTLDTFLAENLIIPTSFTINFIEKMTQNVILTKAEIERVKPGFHVRPSTDHVYGKAPTKDQYGVR